MDSKHAQEKDELTAGELDKVAGGTLTIASDPSTSLQQMEAMQRENQVFSSVSNILKTKHDEAKNSISNIR